MRSGTATHRVLYRWWQVLPDLARRGHPAGGAVRHQAAAGSDDDCPGDCGRGAVCVAHRWWDLFAF